MIERERLLDLYRAMLTSRAIEEFCIELSGHWYPSIGEEATVVGTFSAMADDDFAAPHYRGALIIPWLRGRPLHLVLACVDQSRISPTRGRLYGAFAGGLELGVFPYVTMALGPNLAVGAGAALTFKRRGEPRVALVSLGDGTSGTGDFHESLNLAASLELPAVYVCQNNQFSISTAPTRSLAGGSVSEWASRYGMPSQVIDGNDVVTVHETVQAAMQRARNGGGPSFVEARTYRRTGHFGADPASYRDPAVAAEWEDRDPIARAERDLRAGGATEQQLRAIRDRVGEEMGVAAEQAAAAERLTAADLDAEVGG